MKNNQLEEDLMLQYSFRILIKSKDLKGFQIKRELTEKIPFWEFYYNEKSYENPLYAFINHSFQRHFKFIGNNKAFLADYREREGSLEITFIIILICGYGGIRETVDYFCEDLETFFALYNNFDVSINYEEKKSKQKRKNSLPNTDVIKFEGQLKTLKILLSFSIFLSIVLGMYALSLNEKIIDSNEVSKIIDKKNIDSDEISKMIDEKIKLNNSEIKLDYLFQSEIRENSRPR